MAKFLVTKCEPDLNIVDFSHTTVVYQRANRHDTLTSTEFAPSACGLVHQSLHIEERCGATPYNLQTESAPCPASEVREPCQHGNLTNAGEVNGQKGSMEHQSLHIESTCDATRQAPRRMHALDDENDYFPFEEPTDDFQQFLQRDFGHEDDVGREESSDCFDNEMDFFEYMNQCEPEQAPVRGPTFSTATQEVVDTYVVPAGGVAKLDHVGRSRVRLSSKQPEPNDRQYVAHRPIVRGDIHDRHGTTDASASSCPVLPPAAVAKTPYIGKSQLHNTHLLARKNGLTWCWNCGAYGTEVPRLLTEKCQPPTRAGSQVISRLKKGQPPREDMTKWPSEQLPEFSPPSR